METQATVKPSWAGTVIILLACGAGCLVNLQGLGPDRTARIVGGLLLGAIGASILLDWRHGLRNLIRIDIFALLALYFLLYFEFLFPQPDFELLAIPDNVRFSIFLTLAGFAALTLGRSLVAPSWTGLRFVGEVKLRPLDFFLMLVGAFILANAYALLTVGFNPLDWFAGMLESRFSRPWARGQLGDAWALLSELGLLSYVVPPLTGVIFARRREYPNFILGVTLVIFLIQCFDAFAGGTRYVLAVYVAGLLGAYLVVHERLRIRTIAIYSVLAGLFFIVAANYMLEFRNIGLGQYIEEERYRPAYKEFQDTYLGPEAEFNKSYFVDFNLYNISLLVGEFPGNYEFLGWNLPFVALTKPVPRVLWPSKPVDLKVGMEEAVGARGYTIAATFIGESYIAFGLPGVVVTGLIIGMLCGGWNSLVAYTHSPLALCVYTSGFFALLITMRSLMSFTTALLPTLALLVFAKFLHAHQRTA